MYVFDGRVIGNSFQFTESFRTGRRSSRQSTIRRMEQVPVRRPGEGSLAFQRRKTTYYSRVSEELLAAPKYNGNASVDGGHSFRTFKAHYALGNCTFRQGSSSGPIVIRKDTLSPVVIPADTGSWLQLASKATGVQALPYFSSTVNAKSQLSPLVTNSYHNMIPDLPIAGWGETIVELARGNFPRAIPDLVRRAHFARELKRKPKLRTEAIRAFGSDYLNARFGWEPIIRDTVSTVQHLMAVHDMVFDNVKRKRSTELLTFSGERSGGFVVKGFLSPSDNWDTSLAGTPKAKWYLQADARISARFRKAAPNHRASGFYDRASDFLRDIGFTERLPWDLTPWSWLIDWSGNIGNTIENAFAFGPDGRYYTDYSWVTTKIVGSSHCAAFRAKKPNSLGLVDSSYATSGFTEIRREIISPFGPNFSMPSLSGYQWSILIALGLARAPKA